MMVATRGHVLVCFGFLGMDAIEKLESKVNKINVAWFEVIK